MHPASKPAEAMIHWMTGGHVNSSSLCTDTGKVKPCDLNGTRQTQINLFIGVDINVYGLYITQVITQI